MGFREIQLTKSSNCFTFSGTIKYNDLTHKAIIFLESTVKVTAKNSAVNVTTIPTGYRPVEFLYGFCHNDIGTNTSCQTKAYMIDKTGDITVRNANAPTSATSSSGYTSCCIYREYYY